MKIRIKLIPTPSGKVVSLPEYQSGFSAGADLCACIDGPVTIMPHSRALIPSGIAAEPESPDCGLFIFARSGLASKHGICLANSVGVVDSDYRGEYIVALHNDGKSERVVESGERIAQLVVIPYLSVEFDLVDELDETERGAGGFGSTGK